MAGDWLKVEKATPDKSEIRHIARQCSVGVAEAFASWFRLWCYFDSETSTGELQFLTPHDCDDIGRLKGLGDALQSCRWLEFDAGGARVLNWDRHNGKSAKRRATETRRKKASREKS